MVHSDVPEQPQELWFQALTGHPIPIENPILCPGDLGEDLKREDFRGQSDVRVDSYASWWTSFIRDDGDREKNWWVGIYEVVDFNHKFEASFLLDDVIGCIVTGHGDDADSSFISDMNAFRVNISDDGGGTYSLEEANGPVGVRIFC